MAHLNRILSGSADYDFTSGATIFTLQNVFKQTFFTIEVILTGVTYPAAEDDAEFKIEDNEEEGGAGTFIDIPSQLLTADGGVSKLKFRIVDLNTRNIRVSFDPKSATAGTIEKIVLTAK